MRPFDRSNRAVSGHIKNYMGNYKDKGNKNFSDGKVKSGEKEEARSYIRKRHDLENTLKVSETKTPRKEMIINSREITRKRKPYF